MLLENLMLLRINQTKNPSGVKSLLIRFMFIGVKVVLRLLFKLDSCFLFRVD